MSEELYRQRGEGKKVKMVEDVTIGAMAEWAVYYLLKDKVKKLMKPDMKIYEVKRKSFSPDLTNKKVHFHVKSQSDVSAKRYGASWLFQKEDKLFKEPSDQDYLVFCIVTGDVVAVRTIVKVKDVVEQGLLDEPKVWKYKHSKRAIYLDSVLDSDIAVHYLK